MKLQLGLTKIGHFLLNKFLEIHHLRGEKNRKCLLSVKLAKINLLVENQNLAIYEG